MLTKKCPACFHEIDENLNVCIHCGHRFDKNKRILIGVGIGVAVVILFYIVSLIDNGDSSNRKHNKFEAYIYAEGFVKKSLKSPSTATFPGVSEKNRQIKELGEGRYEIESWVDAQNSFGATTRTNFSCTIIFENETVHCENLKIE